MTLRSLTLRIKFKRKNEVPYQEQVHKSDINSVLPHIWNSVADHMRYISFFNRVI